jgi:uncharacterized protein YjbI with pentapeptide repeats
MAFSERMILMLELHKVASRIALLISGIIIGCAQPKQIQAINPNEFSSEQTGTNSSVIAQPVDQNITSSGAINQLLSNRQCPGCDLERADLRGANLSNADLSRADLAKANLSNANLSGANLTAADLEEVNFTGANLRGANFQGADLEAANFTNADVTGANFTAADLEGVIGLRR